MNSQESIDCLEAVDNLIKKAQRRYDDLIWDTAGMTNEDDSGSIDDNSFKLSGILKQLDHLQNLQEQGIIYEPNF